MMGAMTGSPALLARTHPLIAEAAGRLGRRESVELGGLWGASTALVLAALAPEAPGPILALKQPQGQVFELRVKTSSGELEPFRARLTAAGLDCYATDEDVMRVFVPGDAGARDLFALAAAEGAQVRHLRPSVPTLEDVFAHAIGEE